MPPVPGHVPGAVRTTEPLLIVHAPLPGVAIVWGAVHFGNMQGAGPDLKRRTLCGANRVRVCRSFHPNGLLATVLLHEMREFQNRIERKAKSQDKNFF